MYSVPDEKRLKTHGFAVSPIQIATLRRVAAERGVSTSALLRDILDRSQIMRQAIKTEGK